MDGSVLLILSSRVSMDHRWVGGCTLEEVELPSGGFGWCFGEVAEEVKNGGGGVGNNWRRG